MKKQVLIVACTAILVACGTAKNSGGAKVESMPSQADVERVQGKFPGYTLTDLNDGKKLFDANCALCQAEKRKSFVM